MSRCGPCTPIASTSTGPAPPSAAGCSPCDRAEAPSTRAWARSTGTPPRPPSPARCWRWTPRSRCRWIVHAATASTGGDPADGPRPGHRRGHGRVRCRSHAGLAGAPLRGARLHGRERGHLGDPDPRPRIRTRRGAAGHPAAAPAGADQPRDHLPHRRRCSRLGSAEWEDTEAAIGFARAHGARRIVLMGWSMGGGIALRTSVRSAHREHIAALVLDSPAVDWQDILIYHATALKAPARMRELALWMMTSRIGARMVRLREPLALAEMTPPYYAEHLTHPTLLFHALDDDTVPPAPSRQLAALRPDLIEFVPVAGASHTREWNSDPARY